MRSYALRVQRIEFEARIFVSFGIVALVCVLSFFVFNRAPDNLVGLGGFLGFGPRAAHAWGYLAAAVLVTTASFLRMWAGSVLTSSRMMAFRVQKDTLIMHGPYRVVRNPIYLADFLAFFAFAICLRPIGLFLPVLFLIHYHRLVTFEEKTLLDRHPKAFSSYQRTVPRFLPRLRSLRGNAEILNDVIISYDGFRHNALYLLFIPGFVVAALTDSFIYAIVIGLPGVLDWAVVHTRKGLKNVPNETGGSV